MIETTRTKSEGREMFAKKNFGSNKIINLSFARWITGAVIALSSFSAFSAVEQNLNLSLTSEPPTLDGTKATDVTSFFILGHTMEGLTRLDKSGKVVPGVAEKWEINDKTATFHLRKDSKWSDGSAVTAKDFVFAWRTVLDPKTASEYSFILYHLKNAEKINKGELPITDLGVVAKDDQTLVITFEKPCGYFLSLTTFGTYLPIKEEFFNAQKGKYAADAANLLSNGPFKLTQWVHGASLKLDKNPTYWNSKSITLSTINVPFITPDDSAQFNLFKTGKIDVLNLSKDNLQNAQREKFKLNKFPDGMMAFVRFNLREGRATSNKNLRKAIAAVINVNDYISKVIGIPGTVQALGLVPSYMMGVSKTFRSEHPLAPMKQDLAAAKKYMEAAKQEMKLTGPLSLVWMTGDTPTATKDAEYFQNLLKTTLGIDVKIDKQIFKQRLAKASAGDFDIESAGWGPDYADPMTFVDLFTTWNNNNNGLWKSADYDKNVRAAMNTTNPKARMEAMAAAEKILLEELPIIPTYERTIMYTNSDRLQGVVRRAVGVDPDYTEAKIVK